MANFPSQPPYYGAPYSTFTAPTTPAASPIGSFQNQHPLPHEQAALSFQQNAALPGMNFPAFPPGPPDPAQLAAFWNQVQNGTAMPPIPPPFAHPTSFAPPPPPPPSSVTQSYTPFPLPPKPPQSTAFQNNPAIPLPIPMPAAYTHLMESAGIDREDGEVSEADQWSKAPEGSRAAAQNPQPPARAQAEPNTSSRMMSNGTPNQALHSRPQGASGNSSGQRFQNEAALGSPGARRKLSAGSPRDYAPREGAFNSQRDSSRRTDTTAQSYYRFTPSPAANKSTEKLEHKSALVLAKQREEAEHFVKLLHEVGYGFHDLLREGFTGNPDMLAELYRNLRITIPTAGQPSSSSSSSSKRVEGTPHASGRPSIPGLQGVDTASHRSPAATTTTTTTKTHAAPDAMHNNTSTPIFPAPPKPSTAATHLPPQPSTQPPMDAPKSSGSIPKAQATAVRSPEVPLDRADYIKRLMAAKNSKSASQTKAVSQPIMPSPTPAKGESSIGTPVSAASPAPAPQEEPTKVTLPAVPANQTELTSTSAPKVEDPAEMLQRRKAEANKKLLQKIAAIKAEQEKRPKAENDASNTAASETRSGNTPSGTDLAIKAPKDASSEPQATVPSVNTTKQNSPSLQQPAQAPFSSGIPGLSVPAAMKSQPASQKIASVAPPSLPVRQMETRKRPVASDFDDLEVRPRPFFKRPFGQPKDYLERVVIDFSDDEDSDVDDDEVEGQQQNGFPFAHSAQKISSGAMTPGASTAAEELKKKEAALLSLKRTLARREQQRKAKQLETSRAPTPATPLQEARPLPHTPSVTQTTSQVTGLHSRKESQPSNDASLNASPHSSTDWKTRRRTEIQSGLTAYEAEQADSMKRLEELKLEMQRIEAENLKRQKEKADLISELEGLGIDTEGMHHAELQAKKDEIMQQRDEQTTQMEQESKINAQTHDVQEVSQSTTDSPSEYSQYNAAPRRDPEPVKPVNHDDSTQDSSDGEIEESDANEAAMDMSDSDVEKDNIESSAAIQTIPAEAAPAAEPPFAAEVIADSQAAPAEDSEDFYSPEPDAELPARAVENATAGEDAYPDLDDSMGEGEISDQDISMADAEAEIKPVPVAVAASSEMVEIQHQDEHGPADATQKPSAELVGEPKTTPTSSYIQKALDEGSAGPSSPAQSMASTTTDDGEISEKEQQQTSEPSTREQTQPLTAHEQSPVVADDLAPEIQPEIPRPLPRQAPEVIEMGNEAAVTQQISANPTKPASRFTPYESPLKIFKSYRFHPNYSSEVQGGFRSLTYSHKIDPNKPLCTYEAAGGVCNDNTCESQHFRDMTLSDDHLLVQLGVQPMDTPELDARYRQGLRQVLKELKREKHVKDVEVVASAIAEYRRQFLGDPTRVLVLKTDA